MEGWSDIKEVFLNQFQEEKLKYRNQKVQEIIQRKRKIHAHKYEEAFSEQAEPQEDIEVEIEGTDAKGLISDTIPK